jgi:hypothetical protein
MSDVDIKDQQEGALVKEEVSTPRIEPRTSAKSFDLPNEEPKYRSNQLQEKVEDEARLKDVTRHEETDSGYSYSPISPTAPPLGDEAPHDPNAKPYTK